MEWSFLRPEDQRESINVTGSAVSVTGSAVSVTGSGSECDSVGQ